MVTLRYLFLLSKDGCQVRAVGAAKPINCALRLMGPRSDSRVVVYFLPDIRGWY